MLLPEPKNTKEEEKYNDEDNRLRVFADRKRTNFLREAEQRTILFLVGKIPPFISSDFLTFLGGVGSAIVFLAFLTASNKGPIWLLLGIAGLAINWFGDSLDGRLALYRNRSRKWYGFALDIIMDWLSTVSIGMGYYIYATEPYKWLGFLFVTLYGWAILISQLRYKITDRYTIDSGAVGPTELRVIIALILIAEVLFSKIIQYPAIVISIMLFILNLKDTSDLLKAGDKRDKEEKGLIP